MGRQLPPLALSSPRPSASQLRDTPSRNYRPVQPEASARKDFRKPTTPQNISSHLFSNPNASWGQAHIFQMGESWLGGLEGLWGPESTYTSGGCPIQLQLVVSMLQVSIDLSVFEEPDMQNSV